MTYLLLGLMNLGIGSSVLMVLLRMVRMVRSLQREDAEPFDADAVIAKALAQLSDEDWSAVLGGNYDHLRQKFDQLAKANVEVDSEELKVLKQSRLKMIEKHERSIQGGYFATAEGVWKEIERVGQRIKSLEGKR